ncbi:MAG: ATP synthase F1 subunit delta [Tenuifilaceae bacterium]
MNTGRISVRYAKALYEYAADEKVEAEVYEHTGIVSDIIDSSSDLFTILNNPVILPSEKERIISKVFTGKVHPILIKFINLMVKKRRESFIKNALLVYRKIYRENKGLVRVVIETPVELSEETKSKILSFVTKNFHKTPQVEIKLIPDLIGGFIIEVEGMLFDLSVSGQLAKVRKALVQDQKVL